MLSERLQDVDNLEVLQVNTDGLTVRVSRQLVERVRDICKDFSEMVQIELEEAVYNKMIIRDVNNYIAVYDNGKFKHKGLFEIDRPFHKNHSRRVVPIALHNYFIHDVPVAQTIRQHVHGIDFSNGMFKNYGIFDYLIAKKAVGKFIYHKKYVDVITDKLVIEPIKNKIIRYFVSNSGGVVAKMDKNRINEADYRGELVEAHPQKGRSFYITLFNQYFHKELYDINYSYYIRECNKIIDTINSGDQTNILQLL